MLYDHVLWSSCKIDERMHIFSNFKILLWWNWTHLLSFSMESDRFSGWKKKCLHQWWWTVRNKITLELTRVAIKMRHLPCTDVHLCHFIVSLQQKWHSEIATPSPTLNHPFHTLQFHFYNFYKNHPNDIWHRGFFFSLFSVGQQFNIMSES